MAKKFELNLIDRFGRPPKATKALFDIVRLRWVAINLGIEKIILKNGKMILYFISNKDSLFYHSPIFTRILNYLQQHSKKCQMKEDKKLSLVFFKIIDLDTALKQLNELNTY